MNAEELRLEVERCRRLGRLMPDGKPRALLLRMADEFDLLAEDIETGAVSPEPASENAASASRRI